MLSAIHFNNNAVFKANKINYVIVYGLLPPEFQPFNLFHSQAAPEQLFRICRSFPEGFPQCCYSVHRRITPTLTLPPQGGGKNKKHPLSRGREYYLPTHSEKELIFNVSISLHCSLFNLQFSMSFQFLCHYFFCYGVRIYTAIHQVINDFVPLPLFLHFFYEMGHHLRLKNP